MPRAFGQQRVVLAVLAVFLCAALPASAGSTHDRTVIRVGALVDQTGPSTSPLFRSAVELAAQQMNQALKHGGARVEFEIVYGDTKSNAAIARNRRST